MVNDELLRCIPWGANGHDVYSVNARGPRGRLRPTGLKVRGAAEVPARRCGRLEKANDKAPRGMILRVIGMIIKPLGPTLDVRSTDMF